MGSAPDGKKVDAGTPEVSEELGSSSLWQVVSAAATTLATVAEGGVELASAAATALGAAVGGAAIHKAPSEAAVQCRPCGPQEQLCSPDLEPCSICLDSLSTEALGVCLGPDGRRKCLHYFHLACLQRVEGAHCPQCRERFSKRAAFPSIHDADSWLPLASLSGTGSLNRHETSLALRAMLPLPADEVHRVVETLWHEWTEDDYLGAATLLHIVAAVSDYALKSQVSSPIKAAKAKPAEDDSEKHEGAHGRSGVVCSCGQIHVRRGDRVRRGPAELNDDEVGIATNHLGTIVRVGKGQETVLVKWDRSLPDQAHSYIWPDPDGLVVAPALPGEIAADVTKVQKRTGLSSFAAEALLQQAEFDVATAVHRHEAGTAAESSLRKQLQLYHQVRILPDSPLVQQWFDAIEPCDCSEPDCRGGLQWSSHADKHLGREGQVLKLDSDDDSVLVETIGPCQCKIWYPRLALEPVYNPDLEDKLLHNKNDKVECRMQNGWEAGVVTEVLWNGPARKGASPYSVKLHDGRQISVPSSNLIRKKE